MVESSLIKCFIIFWSHAKLRTLIPIVANENRSYYGKTSLLECVCRGLCRSLIHRLSHTACDTCCKLSSTKFCVFESIYMSQILKTLSRGLFKPRFIYIIFNVFQHYSLNSLLCGRQFKNMNIYKKKPYVSKFHRLTIFINTLQDTRFQWKKYIITCTIVLDTTHPQTERWPCGKRNTARLSRVGAQFEHRFEPATPVKREAAGLIRTSPLSDWVRPFFPLLYITKTPLFHYLCGRIWTNGSCTGQGVSVVKLLWALRRCALDVRGRSKDADMSISSIVSIYLCLK